ncbi:hypothetical protein BDN72DRAFT_830725 [Pluteus cervinus]|uniref:Uncharacterized protein n=1 Tax=Pluteus cervinus TaxID=181527 RepID=A0ACD3BDU0_9AGAR|nr:hypothetical protein BDN72DRAFT_830725 [Pluteus cervinus]
MAPTLRSRKTVAYSQPARFTGPINTTGLAALPPELLLEIVDYFRSVRTVWSVTGGPLPRAQRDRQIVIRILSQLCRSFRHANIEVCTVKEETWAKRGSRIKGIDGVRYAAWQKELAYDLINQLETVTIRNPQYAAHVQNVSVIITRFSLPTVLPEFARCLSLLPNLATLQLHSEVPSIFNFHHNIPLQKAFRGYKYKGIRTLVIPPSNIGILRACPNVHWLHLTQAGYAPNLADDHHQYGLHELTGVSSPFFLSGLASKLPHLNYIQLIASGVYADCAKCIKELPKFPELKTIEIRYPANSRISKKEFDALEKSASDVLGRLPSIQGIKRTVRLRSL